MSRRTIGFIVTLCVLTAGMAAFAQTPLQVKVPKGLPALPNPDDNPITVEKVELGKMLFFDTRLSGDNTVSCSTCHVPDHGYAEPRSTSKGIGGQLGGRNANPVINSAYATSMFWDGRAEHLEAQAGGPVENPIEMGAEMTVVAKNINQVPEYKKRFQAVFGAPASKETITKAIAAFERTLLAGDSPYDRGEMSDLAKQGETLFKGKALCASCHTPPVFSNWGFYNAGVGSDAEKPDEGRMAISGIAADKGAFRVPHLRNAAQTGPYMHDGSIETLEEAVAFMAGGGKDNANLHPLFRAVKAQNLSADDVKALVAFLESLTGDYPVIKAPKLP
ncbi:MAG: c-type cytochrome [bacterium]|nr:c-type cytochrome [bacterium]